MNCNRLWCTCECGQYTHPHSLWITDQKMLLVTCVCVNCEKQTNVLFPLADLFKACPLPALDPKVLNEVVGEEITRITDSQSETELTVDDINFLHAFHIRDEEAA